MKIGDESTELKKLWNGTTPGLVPDRCLNVRHQGRRCRICAEACPADAISVRDGAEGGTAPVELDPDVCVRCGLCLHVCPTGVFVQAEPPESRLPYIVERSPASAIELACPRKEPLEDTRVPGATVVQAPRCLAALSVPILLELGATGKTVWLNDSLCATCPIGKAYPFIGRAIETANRWFHVAVIHSYRTTPDKLSDKPVSRPAVRADRPVMSRRDFFRSLTQTTGSASTWPLAGSEADTPDRSAPPDSAVGPGVAAASDRDGLRLPRHIPAQRQHLARALNRLSPDASATISTAGLPIADVMIDDACTACGLCARFCPTEAISFVSDEAYYVLNFAAALCLGDECSLCVMGCPTDAVHFGKQLRMDELLATQLRPIRTGRLVACTGCGAPVHAPLETSETTETPLCHICRHKPDHPGR